MRKYPGNKSILLTSTTESQKLLETSRTPNLQAGSMVVRKMVKMVGSELSTAGCVTESVAWPVNREVSYLGLLVALHGLDLCQGSILQVAALHGQAT